MASTSSGRNARSAVACHYCRGKKSKCDSRRPCSRCSADNQPCAYSSRKSPSRNFKPQEILWLEAKACLLSSAMSGFLVKLATNESIEFLGAMVRNDNLAHFQEAIQSLADPKCVEDYQRQSIDAIDKNETQCIFDSLPSSDNTDIRLQSWASFNKIGNDAPLSPIDTSFFQSLSPYPENESK